MKHLQAVDAVPSEELVGDNADKAETSVPVLASSLSETLFLRPTRLVVKLSGVAGFAVGGTPSSVLREGQLGSVRMSETGVRSGRKAVLRRVLRLSGAVCDV
ncbi:hypothetical protein FQN49_006748 [Arthroderma sp. PD_2]|nr:hypothetical protein FQN49_006748 [Arthroderma sp. PD_2]